MFIVHGAWFRRNSRWLLGLVLLLLIPSFIFLYTQKPDRARGDLELPKIKGKVVDRAAFDKVRSVILGQIMLSSGGKLTGVDQKEIHQETVVRMVMLKKAEELGIRVTDDEVVQYLRRQPQFVNEQGQFDPERYRQFMIYLVNNRISQEQFEAVVRQQLIVGRLQDLVTTSVKVTPLEVQQTYQVLHEQMHVDYVDFAATNQTRAVTVADAELQAYYETHKDEFRTDRLAKVRYVRFPVETDGQTVSDDDVKKFYESAQGRYTNTFETAKEEIRHEIAKSRALYAAGERATEFTIKLVPEENEPQRDFAAVATESKLAVKQTDYFGLADLVPGINARGQWNAAVFALAPANPVSDPIEGEDGYYVFELIDVKESIIPPLDQVKDRVVSELKEQQALDAVVKEGQEIASKFKQLIATGKTFADAAKELKLKVKQAQPFTLSDEVTDMPAASNMREAAVGMKPGAVSDFVRTRDGGVIFHLKERTPPSPEQFTKDSARFTQLLERQQREAVWQMWVQNLVQQEQVTL